MNVIGLTGLAGSGKSTVARCLAREHGYTQLSFAGPPKAMLRAMDPMLGVNLAYGTANPRPARLSELQEMGEWKVNHGAFIGTPEDYIIGSQYGKEYGQLLRALIGAHRPEFWIDAAMDQLTDEDGKYVFDDVKFQNQANVILGFNPWGLWNIKREGQEKQDVWGASLADQLAGHLGEMQTLFNMEGNTKFLFESVERALGLAFSDTAPLAEAS